MLKFSQGRVRDKGMTWFPELMDKSKHLYMYMYMYMSVWIVCMHVRFVCVYHV